MIFIYYKIFASKILLQSLGCNVKQNCSIFRKKDKLSFKKTKRDWLTIAQLSQILGRVAEPVSGGTPRVLCSWELLGIIFAPVRVSL